MGLLNMLIDNCCNLQCQVSLNDSGTIMKIVADEFLLQFWYLNLVLLQSSRCLFSLAYLPLISSHSLKTQMLMLMLNDCHIVHWKLFQYVPQSSPSGSWD